MGFLINRLLNKHKEVAYLETDLGQPELNAPGLVALHVVSSPLLQPAHSLIGAEGHRCLGAYFCGGTTPSVDPDIYLQMVQRAVNDFREFLKQRRIDGNTKRCPLVV